MKKFFQKTFALSDKGSRGILKASAFKALSDIVLIASSGLVFLFFTDSVLPALEGRAPSFNIAVYAVYATILMVLMLVCFRLQYDATYLYSYEESAAKRISLAEVLRKLPLSFFGKKDISDITTTIMSDTAALENVFSQFVPDLMGAAFSMIIISVMLFFISPQMALAAFWVIPVSFLLCYLTKKQLDRYYKEIKDIQLSYLAKTQEFIENIKDIKANDRKDEHLRSVKEKLLSYEKSSISGELKGGLYVTAAQMVLKIGIATTMLMGINMLASQQIDILIFITFMMIVTRLYDPMSGALVNLAAIFNTLQSVERMKELENTKIQTGKDNIAHNGYDIVFDNVKFAYDESETVLDGISFTAKQGEVTALVGPSGGGKSTAIKLAARFWDINRGKITLGGENISEIDPETLLKNFSIVFQDVTLFNNTVMENIRIGRKMSTDEEVIEAAKAANCHEFVMQLPKGYDTLIGENGSALSGGERQRISIARAFLKDAPIILLDEATSSLDVLNETALQQAISRLSKNKTVIVIAHRMRTITGADKIVLLKDGKVAQTGTHTQLINQDGDYKRMIALQNASTNWTLI